MDRNTVIAIAVSFAVIIGWEFFVLGPQREAYEAAQQAIEAEAIAAQEAAAANGEIPAGAPGTSISPSATGSFAPITSGTNSPAGGGRLTIEQALAAAPGRVRIDTPELSGSINLAGARIDDLELKNYRETVDPESPRIRFLSPVDAEHGHYIEQGWLAGGKDGAGALWTAQSNSVLTPSSPVTLTRKSGSLSFERTISVDEQYMFAVSDKVTNVGSEGETVIPWGIVIQRNIPEDFRDFLILHEGPIAVVDNSLFERKYKKARTAVVEKSGARGWVGITNKYWLAAAIPPQGEAFKAELRNVGTEAEPIFRASYAMDPRNIAPGESIELTSNLFGGAKVVDILQSYEKEPEQGGLGVWDFDKAVDWGNFFFLTRPIFITLNFFGNLFGNFGVAILLLTLVIKALLFPLANKAYESMSKMKKMQPQLEKLKERCGDDKAKLQQEMMALYKKEKLNPLAGCVPIIIQMPIFYALYKTLFVTIELRHEGFLGYIKDLSAPDPTSIFNLFGLLPYDPTALPVVGAFLGLGILPLLMGAGMWFQTKLNPPATDPTQQMIFNLMPLMFMFLFAGFASGLVLYWFWNTALSIAQQYFIMRRNGVDVDWGERFSFLKPKSPAPGE
ncbi:MAG: membrane protein insertase YidC [Pseudomonadota bacterium]